MEGEQAMSEKHFCDPPDWWFHSTFLPIGSLWQCEDCGREQIKVDKEDRGSDWRYTVEILDKRVQRARAKKQ